MFCFFSTETDHKIEAFNDVATQFASRQQFKAI